MMLIWLFKTNDHFQYSVNHAYRSDDFADLDYRTDDDYGLIYVGY